MSETQDYESQAGPLRERASQQFSPEMQAELKRIVADLDATVVAEAPAEGDVAPDFTLREAGSGAERSLSASLKRGPVVLSFYRGQW